MQRICEGSPAEEKVRKAQSNVMSMPGLHTKNGAPIVVMSVAAVEVAVVVAVVVLVAEVGGAAVVAAAVRNGCSG